MSMQRITTTRNAKNEDAPTKTTGRAFSIARNTTCLSGYNASASLRPRSPPHPPREDNLHVLTCHRKRNASQPSLLFTLTAARSKSASRKAFVCSCALLRSVATINAQCICRWLLAGGLPLVPPSACLINLVQTDKGSLRGGRERLARGGDKRRGKENLDCSFSPRRTVESPSSVLESVCPALFGQTAPAAQLQDIEGHVFHHAQGLRMKETQQPADLTTTKREAK